MFMFGGAMVASPLDLFNQGYVKALFRPASCPSILGEGIGRNKLRGHDAEGAIEVVAAFNQCGERELLKRVELCD